MALKKWRVSYYYLATGMEGQADIREFPIVEAETSDEAKDKITMLEYPTDIMYGPNNSYSSREFFRSCLSVFEVDDNGVIINKDPQPREPLFISRAFDPHTKHMFEGSSTVDDTTQINLDLLRTVMEEAEKKFREFGDIWAANDNVLQAQRCYDMADKCKMALVNTQSIKTPTAASDVISGHIGLIIRPVLGEQPIHLDFKLSKDGVKNV